MNIYLERMIIDEEKCYPLSRYLKGEKKDSDHHTLILDLNISFQKKNPERKEVFNFRNKECQENFYLKTEVMTSLVKCFANENSLEKQSSDCFESMNRYFHQCFTKITSSTKK